MNKSAIVQRGRIVEIMIDGEAVTAHEGEPLAAVFLRLKDIHTRRVAKSNAARAPLCMMGVCYECLVHIDGIGFVRSCQETVQSGMRIERSQGVRRLI